ncbi:hypothetical protein BSLG_005618 [Batrachochytrium salamandrivorans]|nr:hypothetical protein BSLG_005618 [Batrachochytrium salamandrivorans]
MSSRSFTRIITTKTTLFLHLLIMCRKGTQTKWLASNYGIRTISSGDVLRSNVLQKTPVGLQAKAIIEAGGLVNDSLVNDLMLTEMKGMPDSQRIEDRWIHAPSGRTYSISYNPPLLSGRDDVTGEPLTKRSDDDVDIFKSRLEAYRSQTMPLIGYYTNQGILCNFKGSTSDEIYPQIQDTLHAYYGCSITADTKPAKTCTSTDSTSVSTLSTKTIAGCLRCLILDIYLSKPVQLD